jgi:geranylgeranyl diphosphate synthase type II
MFGEPTAILVGDALLTLAFESLAGAPATEAQTALRMVGLLAQATGSRGGIIGGQGLELQTNVDVNTYHAQKTSALFRAAAGGGALAADRHDEFPRWARFGELIGRALQLRDDLDDCLSTAERIGKPVGQDAANGRPNAVERFGADEVGRVLDETVREALSLLGPATPSSGALRDLVGLISGR